MFVYRVGQRQIDVVKYVKHRVGSCVVIYYCVVFHVNNGTYFCPILYMIFRDICRHIMFETFMRVSLCLYAFSEQFWEYRDRNVRGARV